MWKKNFSVKITRLFYYFEIGVEFSRDFSMKFGSNDSANDLAYSNVYKYTLSLSTPIIMGVDTRLRNFFCHWCYNKKKSSRQIGSNSSIFEVFRVQFILKSRCRGTPSKNSSSKNRIFPCFFDIDDPIAQEILGENISFTEQYILSMCLQISSGYDGLVAHT